MPRIKYDTTHPYAQTIRSIACLKQPCMDVIHDFKVIYPFLYEWFQDDLTPEYTQIFMDKYNEIKDIPVNLSNRSRLYVITGMSYVPLALFDMDESILNNIQRSVDNFPYVLPDPDYCICDAGCDPSHSISLFIFKGNELAFSCDRISIILLIHLLQAFPKENQINTSGTRQAFYAAPRRNPERY